MALDKDHGMLLGTLDLSSAFDTISHDVIIDCLYAELRLCGIVQNVSCSQKTKCCY